MKFFDKNLPIKIISDATKLGLREMLEHFHGTVWYPTAFDSRSLTTTEQNYGQIKKGTLSIVFLCEKLRKYVYGVRFVVENDHKPLITIFQRTLTKSLSKYDVPGNQVFVAGMLSRLPLPDSTSEIKSNDMNCFAIKS